MVVCLEQGVDLHMAQLMSLPLTVSCFSKIQIGFTFLVPAHPGCPGKRAVKRVCVCVQLCKNFYKKVWWYNSSQVYYVVRMLQLPWAHYFVLNGGPGRSHRTEYLSGRLGVGHKKVAVDAHNCITYYESGRVCLLLYYEPSVSAVNCHLHHSWPSEH